MDLHWFSVKPRVCPNNHNGCFKLHLRENLVHYLPHVSAPRWLQIAHRGFHIRMAEPLLHGAQIEARP